MRLEFRRKVLTCTDAFKRAVYCVVANCDSALDHPEVADKIEDWLWLRLTLARHGELKRRADSAEKSALGLLQHQISVEFGWYYIFRVMKEMKKRSHFSFVH